MVIFSQTESSLDLFQIQKVEDLLELRFPQSYIDHLLKFNGGRCEPNIFSFEEDGTVTESCVDWFLAIYDGEYDSLVTYIRDYKIAEKRLPSNIVPIAHDPGGNLICISCEGDDKGYIYFWNHEKEVDYTRSGNENYSNLYLISDSLNSFLESLR